MLLFAVASKRGGADVRMRTRFVLLLRNPIVGNMSYREVRNFTEMMQTLGYPRIISMENFRQPNFTLVAEILVWLIQRYDPSLDLSTDIETEQDRVIFIKSAAQLMATKAHIKLNTKKLYGADGYAVKELLKIATLLYSALRSNKDDLIKETSTALPHTQLTNKNTDLKACRQLASEITSKGSRLYELLGQEVNLREARLRAISQPVDIDKIEKGIEMSVAAVNDEIQRTNMRMENAASDERTLEVRIEKKEQELIRKRKRLESLAKVRPAFMDEYEKLESEFKVQYEVYMEKFRNLCYLEQKLEEHKVDQEKVEDNENPLLEMKMQFQQENTRTLNEDVVQEGTIETDVQPPAPRYVGNMTGEGIASDDGSVSLSSGSRNDDEMLKDLQEEDEETRSQGFEDSDEDF